MHLILQKETKDRSAPDGSPFYGCCSKSLCFSADSSTSLIMYFNDTILHADTGETVKEERQIKLLLEFLFHASNLYIPTLHLRFAANLISGDLHSANVLLITHSSIYFWSAHLIMIHATEWKMWCSTIYKSLLSTCIM